MELHPRAVMPTRLVEDIRRLFQLGMQEKGLDWRTEIGPDVPSMVLLDEGRLRQILLNLVGNALKFTPEGSVLLRLEAGPGQTDGHVSLRFEVHDSGIGMPEAELGQIFAPFYQVERTDKRRFAGTGLGLAIVRAIAEAHDGTAYVTSATAAGGAKFVIDLPGRREAETARPRTLTEEIFTEQRASTA